MTLSQPHLRFIVNDIRYFWHILSYDGFTLLDVFQNVAANIMAADYHLVQDLSKNTFQKSPRVKSKVNFATFM